MQPLPSIALDVAVACEEWRRIDDDVVGICRETAMATLRHLGAGGRPAELSIVLADDATVTDLNRRYRGQDKPTNVLSFPGEDEGLAACRGSLDGFPVMLGDVILAAETVFAEARAQGKPATHHLRHLVVHGVLHLLGFDHEKEEEAERMEGIEKTVLAGLGVPDPYAADALAAHA